MRLVKPGQTLRMAVFILGFWTVMYFDSMQRRTLKAYKENTLDLQTHRKNKDDNHKEYFKFTHLSNKARSVVEKNEIAAGSQLKNLSFSKVLENKPKPSVLKDQIVSERKDNQILFSKRTPGDGSYDCDSWKLPGHWIPPASPQIALNPNRFIYPGLCGGPNNEIAALKQAVYLAIRLNRTLVVPKFLSHVSIGMHDQFPHERIDVNRLCSFVSCISIEGQKERCGNEFDVLFKARIPNPVLIRRYERLSELLIHNKTKVLKIPGSAKLRLSKSKTILNIPSLPADDSQITFEPWLKSDEATLRKTYNTDAPCAIYSSSLQSIGMTPIKLALPLLKSNQDISNISDNTLYSAISNAIWLPSCIINTAADYVKSVLGTFIGVHWRYNFLDWHLNGTRKNKPELTKWVLRITPADLAQSLMKRVDISGKKKTIFVYLAMPTSLEDFKIDVYGNLSVLNSVFQKPKIDLKEFLSSGVANCWKINKWSSPGNIFSLLEMEIIRRSKWFFYSPGSSWSSNIREQRKLTLPNGEFIRKYEVSVVEGAKKVIQDRINNQKKK